jgi:hypothetical protein
LLRQRFSESLRFLDLLPEHYGLLLKLLSERGGLGMSPPLAIETAPEAPQLHMFCIAHVFHYQPLHQPLRWLNDPASCIAPVA